MAALLHIFPKAVTEDAKRHGLRLLEKLLSATSLDLAVLVAMLCFWQEEKGGILQYSVGGGGTA